MSFTINVTAAADGTSEAMAQAVLHTIRETYGLPASVVFVGFVSDSGGGGTKESGGEHLTSCGLTSNDCFIIGVCTLHLIQLEIANPVKVAFGLQGLGKRTAMQLLHALYDLQKNYDPKLWKEFWKGISTEELEDFCRMVESKLSRWWTTGKAAALCIDNWDRWLVLANRILKMKATKSTHAAHPIASGIISLMDQVEIKLDVASIRGFYDAYIAGHFKWLQRVDPNIKLPGYLSFHILVRLFLMESNLLELADGNWKTNLSFQKVLEVLDELSVDDELQGLTEDKVETAIRIALTVHREHWTRWKAELLVVAAFGEHPFGCLVARFLLAEEEHCDAEGKPKYDDLDIADGVVYSPIQDRNIHIEAFIDFLCDDMSILNAARDTNKLFQCWQQELRVVATGVDIWSDGYGATRAKVLEGLAAFMSNTHETERAVKTSKEGSRFGRQETKAAEFTIVKDFYTKMSYHMAGGYDENRASDELYRGPTRLDHTFQITRMLPEAMIAQEEADPDAYQKKRDKIEKVQEEGVSTHHYQRNKLTLESFRKAEDLPDVENALTRAEGVDRTAFMSGKVLVSDIAQRCKDPPHYENLIAELDKRNVVRGEITGIRELKKLLVADEKMRWIAAHPGEDVVKGWDKSSFKVLTGREKFARPDKYNNI